MVAKLFTQGAMALTLTLALSACGGDDESERNLSSLDESLANASDPALRGALEDQIVVDPELAGQSNGHAVRPGSKPADGAVPAAVLATEYQAPVGGKLFRAPKAVEAPSCKGCGVDKPVTLGALAREQGGRAGGCDANLQYGASWANRLPVEFPVFPKAKLMEAAGAESGHCALRAASFVTSQPMQNVIDFYYTKALKSGFDAEHQLLNGEHVLGGVRKKDDGAYFITFAQHKGGGTAVDIVANNGR